MGINDIIEYIGQGDWTASADGGFVIVYQPSTTDPSGKILTQSRGYAFPASGLGGGGGSVGTLQEVLDAGNTTNTDIQFGAGAGILLDNGSRLREGTIDAGTGGTKGIAQICAVGYELKWEAGSQYVMDGNGLLIREVNHKFDTAPTVTNDESEGFQVGSRWILDDGTIYTCTDDSTGAAVWDVQFPVISLKVNLSAAEIKTLNSFPIDIGLPSSGIGYYYRVTAFDCKLNYGTEAFASTYLSILSTTGGNAQLTWSPLLSIGNTVFSTSFVPPNITDNIVENDTISIISDADSAVGDSTIECYISVQKIKL